MRAFRAPEIEIIVMWMVNRNLPIYIVYGYALYVRRRQRNFKNPVAVAVVYQRIASRRAFAGCAGFERACADTQITAAARRVNTPANRRAGAA